MRSSNVELEHAPPTLLPWTLKCVQVGPIRCKYGLFSFFSRVNYILLALHLNCSVTETNDLVVGISHLVCLPLIQSRLMLHIRRQCRWLHHHFSLLRTSQWAWCFLTHPRLCLHLELQKTPASSYQSYCRRGYCQRCLRQRKAHVMQDQQNQKGMVPWSQSWMSS